MEAMEVRGIEPNELVLEIETAALKQRENKYAFQLGLKDLDFDISEALLVAHGLNIPLTTIAQAEQALMVRAITPIELIEIDGTRHLVLAFDPRPVGYSGFMDCVTHSLALTNLGLFEVGRYFAVNLSSESKIWQWFLHRRLALPQEVNAWSESHGLSSGQYLSAAYDAIVFG